VRVIDILPARKGVPAKRGKTRVIYNAAGRRRAGKKGDELAGNGRHGKIDNTCRSEFWRGRKRLRCPEGGKGVGKRGGEKSKG